MVRVTSGLLGQVGGWLGCLWKGLGLVMTALWTHLAQLIQISHKKAIRPKTFLGPPLSTQKYTFHFFGIISSYFLTSSVPQILEHQLLHFLFLQHDEIVLSTSSVPNVLAIEINFPFFLLFQIHILHIRAIILCFFSKYFSYCNPIFFLHPKFIRAINFCLFMFLQHDEIAFLNSSSVPNV